MTAALVRVFVVHPDRRTRNRVLGGFGLAALAAALALGTGAPAVVGFLTPGFSGQTQVLAARYLARAAPYVPLAAGYFVLQAWANARGVFLFPALGMMAFNLAVLAACAAAAGSPRAGDALVFGLVLGGVAQLTCAVAGASRTPVPPGAGDGDGDGVGAGVGGGAGAAPLGRGAVDALAMALPTMGITLLMQFQFLFERALVSTGPEGATIRYSTAQKLVHLPLGLLAVPLVTALIPFVADQALRRGGEVRPGVRAGLNALTWLIAPVATGISAAALEVVTTLFGRGRFGTGDLYLTAQIVAAATPATLAAAFSMWMVRGHLARGDARTPALTKGAGTAALLVLDVYAFRRIGPRGLFFAAMVVHTLEGAWLYRRLGVPWRRVLGDVLGPLARVAPACVTLFWLLRTALAAWGPTAGPPPVLTLAASALAAGAGFVTVAAVAGAPSPGGLLRELRDLGEAPRAGTPAPPD